ncbi:hypothetical protein PLICRDRAFT_176717 [Plicaturopsis crispa FD-325 SS-3]|nr:hypothetical protein PLICRDRAFT_176717 [Plicaturopsis crispa FD-325 SS-3]
MSSVAAARAASAAHTFPSRPIALFIGGTSGIGQGTVEAFARSTKGNAHIIVCGRSRAAADSIIASFPKPANGATHEFVQCDVSLMRNVHATTESLLARLPKLNYLFISTGILTVSGRNETEEGIDLKLATHYYSRWKFINELTPLLQKAADAGEDAKVMAVLAAGKNTPVDLDDLGLKKTFSLRKAAMQGPAYNDLMVEEFAARHPDIAFTHAYPGAVRTSLINPTSGIMKYTLAPVLIVLVYPFSLSLQESGEYMLRGLLSSEKGANYKGPKAEDVIRNSSSTPETRQKLWDHTLETTSV